MLESMDTHSKGQVSDHQAIDKLRTLAVMYLDKGISGETLSAFEVKIIQTMVSGFRTRKQLDDSEEKHLTFLQMIAEANKEAWKYEQETEESRDFL